MDPNVESAPWFSLHTLSNTPNPPVTFASTSRSRTIAHLTSTPHADDVSQTYAPNALRTATCRLHHCLPRVLARPAAAARLVALAKIELLGEALFDQIVDRGVERIETAQLLALELGKGSINTRDSRRHLRSFEDMPTCPTSGYKVR